MYKRFFIILITLALSTLACSIVTVNLSPGQRIEGSGKLASETRDVSGFTAIVLQGSANVDVAFGESESVVVETDDNILPLIETKVQQGQLFISTRSNTSITSSKPVRVHVTMKSLDGVSLPGSGNIDVPELNGAAIKVDLPGSGNITLQGTANSVNIILGGSGIVSCGGLKAKTATVNMSGSGNVTVYASDSLDATLSGSGIIQYSGNPARVNKNVSGSGNITP